MTGDLIICMGCGMRRRQAAGGLCNTCYNCGAPGQRGRHKHTIYMDYPPSHVHGAGGLELSTLFNPHAEVAERARRIEVYRLQVEERPGEDLDPNDQRLRED